MPIQVYELCFALGICIFFTFFGNSILNWCEKKYKEWNENLTMTLMLLAGSIILFMLSASSKSLMDCVFMSFLGALCFGMCVWAFIRYENFRDKKKIEDGLTRRAAEEALKKEMEDCAYFGRMAMIYVRRYLTSPTK